MLTAGREMMIKRHKWFEIGRELLSSLLFPPRCPVCDEILTPEEVEKGIHLTCESKFYSINGAVCMHCGKPIGSRNPKQENIKFDIEQTREYCYDCIAKGYHRHSCITQAKALYVYKGVIKQTMYRFKYSNKREYASFFAKQAMKEYGVWMRQKGIEVIIPVPMYKKKQRRRGYNQAESFAKELSCITGVPYVVDLVRRVRNTTPQKGLTEKERKNNLEKAFQIRENVVQYTCAMVVDDIYTTGSTAEAVARELIKQGTHRVYLLTICIGEDM